MRATQYSSSSINFTNSLKTSRKSLVGLADRSVVESHLALLEAAMKYLVNLRMRQAKLLNFPRTSAMYSH